MQESKIFLILIDETTDVSHPEQVSFVVRYVHTRKTKERFIQVCNVHSISGDALGNLVVALLEQNDLEIENVQGQGYNWAANMSGHCTGLRSKKNPKAKSKGQVRARSQTLPKSGVCSKCKVEHLFCEIFLVANV